MSDQIYKHFSYHIIILSDNLYALLASEKEVITGSLAQVFAIMVKRYHLPADQIEHALLKMCNRDHSVAEFNRFGTFIATSARTKKVS